MTKASTHRPAKLPPDAELLSIPEAYKQLGKGYSRRSIFRRISSGEWIEGLHWIDDRPQNSARRIIKINVTAVNELRATPAAFR
jgi:hypothetical protein